MAFERTVLTSRVEDTARVVVACAACKTKGTIYLAIIGKWIELHRRRNPAHMHYTINAHV